MWAIVSTMPLIASLSSLTTDELRFVRPSDFGSPDLIGFLSQSPISVILIFAIISHDLLNRESPAFSNLRDSLHRKQSGHRRPNDIDGGFRAKRFAENVLDAGKFKHSADRPPATRYRRPPVSGKTLAAPYLPRTE